MNQFNKEAIFEAFKEVARIAVFAAITAIIGWATMKLSSYDPTSEFYIIGTTLLRAIDKYIHERKDVPLKGITPF